LKKLPQLQVIKFKQMIKIYGNGFGDAERKNYAPIIYNNIILNMKMLVENLDKFGQTTSCPDAQAAIANAKEEDEVNEKLGAAVKALWADAGIQATYAQRSKFQLNDSTAYYMTRIDDIIQADFVPTEQDVLRSRVPTTGIVENSFEIDGNQFKMYDVGGQRSERKKWIHCFENVTAVLFVAAISAYDQVLYEDETTGRMHEALELFDEITNSEWFVNTSTILFLNKKDIFEEKLKTIPLKDFFPEYQGGEAFEENAKFIQDMFELRNHQEKDIYPHLTCATDTKNILTVFTFVKDIIIKKGLSRAGLM
jgi:guanine nucleotide-binding protein G(i) subunit alpha